MNVSFQDLSWCSCSLFRSLNYKYRLERIREQLKVGAAHGDTCGQGQRSPLWGSRLRGSRGWLRDSLGKRVLTLERLLLLTASPEGGISLGRQKINTEQLIYVLCKLPCSYFQHEKSRCYESLAHDCEVQHTSSTPRNCILSTGVSSVNYKMGSFRNES